ncbi:hypothetical protein BDN71DRAFT_1510853 [Pleurotus eryngii]|uniref:Uncharacterized protein n=1 Tax=Pleurotus eryngii TaxID=5323 RepID=A0A9P5ZNU5_PLEER|nr:hypothetical protein BDN71DRAFT_1510853 [Pleurotus eryngii]
MSSSPLTLSGYDLHWMDTALKAEGKVRQDASRAFAASTPASTVSSLSPPNNYSDESLHAPDAHHSFMPFSTSAGSYDPPKYPVANALETLAQEAATNPFLPMAGTEYTDAPAAFPVDGLDGLGFETLREYVAAMSSASTPECIMAPYTAFPEADDGLLFNQLQAPSLPAQYRYQYHPSSGCEYFHPPSALPRGMAPENGDIPQIAQEYGHQINMQEIEAICDSVEAEYLAATRGATLCTEPLSATRRPNEPAPPAPGASTSAKSVAATDNKGKGRARNTQENVGYIQDATTSAFLPYEESDQFAQYNDQALYSALQRGGQDEEWGPGTQYRFKNTFATREASRKRKHVDRPDSFHLPDRPKRIKRTYIEISPGVYACPLCDEELDAKSKKKHGGQCGRTESVCNICGYITENRRNDSLAVHQRTAKCRAAALLSTHAAVPVSIGACARASSMAPSATGVIDGGHGYDTSDGEFQARGEGNEAGPSSSPLGDMQKTKDILYRCKPQKH